MLIDSHNKKVVNTDNNAYKIRYKALSNDLIFEQAVIRGGLNFFTFVSKL